MSCSGVCPEGLGVKCLALPVNIWPGSPVTTSCSELPLFCPGMPGHSVPPSWGTHNRVLLCIAHYCVGCGDLLLPEECNVP